MQDFSDVALLADAIDDIAGGVFNIDYGYAIPLKPLSTVMLLDGRMVGVQIDDNLEPVSVEAPPDAVDTAALFPRPWLAWLTKAACSHENRMLFSVPCYDTPLCELYSRYLAAADAVLAAYRPSEAEAALFEAALAVLVHNTALKCCGTTEDSVTAGICVYCNSIAALYAIFRQHGFAGCSSSDAGLLYPDADFSVSLAERFALPNLIAHRVLEGASPQEACSAALTAQQLRAAWEAEFICPQCHAPRGESQPFEGSYKCALFEADAAAAAAE